MLSSIQYYQNMDETIEGEWEGKREGEIKESTIYWKIAPLKALMEWEGWKVFLLKGMYATRLLASIQVI
jgi:hypothetical protein